MSASMDLSKDTLRTKCLLAAERRRQQSLQCQQHSKVNRPSQPIPETSRKRKSSENSHVRVARGWFYDSGGDGGDALWDSPDDSDGEFDCFEEPDDINAQDDATMDTSVGYDEARQDIRKRLCLMYEVTELPFAFLAPVLNQSRWHADKALEGIYHDMSSSCEAVHKHPRFCEALQLPSNPVQQDLECPICLCDVDDSDEVVVLICSHKVLLVILCRSLTLALPDSSRMLA